MSSSVSLIHSFRKLSISITVTSDSSSSMSYSSSTGKSSPMSSFAWDRTSNMDSFLDNLTYTSLGIGNVSVLCVPAAVSKRGLLTCSVSKILKRRSWLDIWFLCVKTIHQWGFMNSHMITQTEKGIFHDFSIALLHAYPFYFFKKAFSYSNTWFFKNTPTTVSK